MAECTTRPAQPEDAEAVFALLTQFVNSYQPDRQAFNRNFPKLISSDHSVFLVAVDAGEVVGYALGCVATTLYANGPILELHELMVAPEYRGYGVGRALVEATLDRARAAGCTEATVPTRRAKEYYLKLGFEETAVYLKRKLPGRTDGG